MPPIGQEIPKELMSSIEDHAAREAHPVSLSQLYEYARFPDDSTYLRAAQYLHMEMPIRLAKKVCELQSIPNGLSQTRNVQIVRDWYVRSFKEIVESPFPVTHEQEAAFTDMVEKIKERHKNQVQVMAWGIRDYMTAENLEVISDELQLFLDGFFLSRIGIRVLLGHHVASHEERKGWVGIICAQTSPYEVAKSAAETAAQICRQTYGDPPVVKFHGRLNLHFRYIPSHLHHMFFELFKNSFRATIEHNRHKDKLPSVHVVIAGGMEDVSIKISDGGGGIPRSGIDRIWTYAYTTANPDLDDLRRDDGSVLAGLGYGLPLSRLYARYFGGDLKLVSLEGFGTDAYLHLSRLGIHGESIA